MTIRQLLKDNPDFMDYTICLSQFFTVSNDGDDLDVVTDFPVLGIGSNDEEKELRFIVEAESLKTLKNAKTRVVHLVDQKLAELRDDFEEE